METFSYQLKLQYDGFDYLGWQIQKEKSRTIQGQLNLALEKICKSKRIETIGSGRTDAGVHALGQIVKATIPQKLPINAISKGLNSLLPASIRVIEAKRCSLKFDPIRDAKYKEYRYFFTLNEDLSPLFARYLVQAPYGKYSIPLMREACRLFEGVHDFNNFYCKGTPISSTIREIYHCRLEKCDETPLFIPKFPASYVLQIQGSGFLKQMVRLMVGTLWSTGQGKLKLSDLEKALEGKLEKRKKLGIVSPPQGLYLQKVVY